MPGLYNRILVPLDGSEVANQALPYAQQLAKESGAELVLFCAVPNLKSEVTVRNNMPYVELKTDEQQYLVDHATRWLQRLVDDFAVHTIKAQPVIDVGNAADSIVDYATVEGIDMIVMSTHGRTGIARWTYGSVAAKVLARAGCPVLLVRSKVAGTSTMASRQEPATMA